MTEFRNGILSKFQKIRQFVTLGTLASLLMYIECRAQIDKEI